MKDFCRKLQRSHFFLDVYVILFLSYVPSKLDDWNKGSCFCSHCDIFM